MNKQKVYFGSMRKGLNFELLSVAKALIYGVHNYHGGGSQTYHCVSEFFIRSPCPGRSLWSKLYVNSCVLRMRSFTNFWMLMLNHFQVFLQRSVRSSSCVNWTRAQVVICPHHFKPSCPVYLTFSPYSTNFHIFSLVEEVLNNFLTKMYLQFSCFTAIRPVRE